MEVLETLDAGVLGAALMGVVGGGITDDLEALAEERARVSCQIDSDEDGRARLDDLYGVYAETYQALEPTFSKLRQRSETSGSRV